MKTLQVTVFCQEGVIMTEINLWLEILWKILVLKEDLEIWCLILLSLKYYSGTDHLSISADKCNVLLLILCSLHQLMVLFLKRPLSSEAKKKFL